MRTALPRVFLTRTIPDNGMALLRSHTDLHTAPQDSPIAKPDLIAGVVDAEGLLCMLTDPVDADVIAAAPGLRVISSYAVGFNNIDIAAAKERGIIVTNTPGVLTDATADIAFALMLACARRIAEGDRWMRSHTFEGWAPMQMLGKDLAGATLGVIGAGRIGLALARRCHGAYGMHVVYHSRHRNEIFESEFDAEYASLEHLLRESDYVSLHVPLTPDTHHMLGAHELSLMKHDAVLVNTSRGPVVHEAALIRALQEHRLFAAGLDVFEHEPAVPDELLELDNVVVLPHIGSGSISARARMADMATRNLIDVLEGRDPEHRVV